MREDHHAIDLVLILLIVFGMVYTQAKPSLSSLPHYQFLTTGRP